VTTGHRHRGAGGAGALVDMAPFKPALEKGAQYPEQTACGLLFFAGNVVIVPNVEGNKDNEREPYPIGQYKSKLGSGRSSHAP
jgi:hypothetical protein